MFPNRLPFLSWFTFLVLPAQPGPALPCTHPACPFYHLLQRNGAEVTVLEARDRAGGRVHSFQADGFTAPVDLGACGVTGSWRSMGRSSAGWLTRRQRHGGEPEPQAVSRAMASIVSLLVAKA